MMLHIEPTAVLAVCACLSLLLSVLLLLYKIGATVARIETKQDERYVQDEKDKAKTEHVIEGIDGRVRRLETTRTR